MTFLSQNTSRHLHTTLTLTEIVLNPVPQHMCSKEIRSKIRKAFMNFQGKPFCLSDLIVSDKVKIGYCVILVKLYFSFVFVAFEFFNQQNTKYG